MNTEDERLLRLIRSGRETIIKYGTYDMVKARPIVQDHPFYVQQMPQTLNCFEDEILTAPVQEQGPELSAEELASQITSSNFKVGMSQDEVDALLASMSY